MNEALGNETIAVTCDEDPNPLLRLLFISVGTLIAFVGCASSLILLSIFCCQHRTNPFQTFLAFLDFMLCFLFIVCFGALSFATTFRIEWLYILHKKHSVYILVLGRIVQMSIPYILIAITADRLTSIAETTETNLRRASRILTLILITTVIVIVRLPGIYTMQVIDIDGCDLFSSKALSGVEMEEPKATYYHHFDVVVQFFHLFVSFVILCVLNIFVVERLHTSQQRRQSLSSSTMLSIKGEMYNDLKMEQKRLRYSIHTSLVVISSYLACNSVNFVLYAIEVFNKNLIFNEDGNFNVFYVAASDLGTNLFVLSSAIRLFIFYRYNPELRVELRQSTAFRLLFGIFFMRRGIDERQKQLLSHPSSTDT